MGIFGEAAVTVDEGVARRLKGGGGDGGADWARPPFCGVAVER